MSADVVISPTGVQGPRGNTVLSGIGAPSSSTGVDGDYYGDVTNWPTSWILHGPKTAGAWPAQTLTVTSGGVQLAGDLGGSSSSPQVVSTHLASPLPLAQGGTGGTSQASAQAALGLGSAATQSSSAFDAAGAASAAEAGAIADAATKYTPLMPWVFDVTAAAYGAKGDGRIVVDGAMGIGSTTLTSNTASFVAGDHNKIVMVKGAAATGVTTLIGFIQTVNSPTSVTLSVANASGSALTGLTVVIATDDTAAIQAAINAAVAYAEARTGGATVFFPAGIYGVGGPLVTTSAGNAQLTIPVVATTGNKLVLTFQGASDGAAVQHWQQVPPQMSGSTIVSFGVFTGPGTQATSINNHGNPALLGGPSQPGGYGISPGVFSNVEVVVRQLSLRTTHSAYGLGYTAADFSGLANAALHDVGYGSMGTVAAGDFQNPSVFGTGASVGLLMPSSGNNDLCVMDNVTCAGGYTYAAFVTEHTDLYGVRLLYSWAGLCPVGLYYGSVGSTHAIRGFVSVEACHYHLYLIGPGSGGIGIFLHLVLDTEGSVLFGDNDSGTASASAKGSVVLTGEVTFPISLDHPIGFDLINDQLSFPTAAVSSSYTVQPWDEVIEATGTITVTLPSAATRTKRVVVVNTGSGTVTVQATGGELISGAASKTLTGQWSHAEYTPSASLNSWNQIA